MIESYFFDVIRYSLDPNSNIPDHITDIDWIRLYKFAEEQGILGVVFVGIQRLGEQGLKPPFDVLMEWIGNVQNIENQNRLMNERCAEIVATFQKEGFETCILKGQGNAIIYPNPLRRTSGDIDIWVLPKSDGRCKKEDVRGIIKYVKKRNPNGKVCYHHIDYGTYEGVDVEVHYRPSFMFNPVHNGRLQKWFCKMADGGCLMAELPENAGTIRIPNREFNIIFQLSHIYNHLLHEGIGLRQIIDYYYVLINNKELEEVKGRGQKEDGRGKMDDVTETLRSLTSLTSVTTRQCANEFPLRSLFRRLGLWKIAGAMMWVLHDKLGLEEEYLIAPMDEKRGKLLLNEILRGGNFGHYDIANRRATTPFGKNIQRLKRDFRMICYFPSECLCEPAFRVYHFFWRQRQKFISLCTH